MSGDFIKNARLGLGISQTTFAELLELGKRGAATISDWERGVKKVSKYYQQKILQLTIFHVALEDNSSEKVIKIQVEFALTYNRLKHAINYLMQNNKLDMTYSYANVTRDEILEHCRKLFWENGVLLDEALPYDDRYNFDVEMIKKLFSDINN